MSTRAFVLVSEFPRRYVVYYRHCDGYPTGLGLELIRAVQSGVVKPEELAEQLDLEEYFRWVTDPTEAFPVLQADIEWVYEVRGLYRPTTHLHQDLQDERAQTFAGFPLSCLEQLYELFA